MVDGAASIERIEFSPGESRNLLQYSVLRIRVRVVSGDAGINEQLRVVIRTNVNQARRIRRQIIDQVERGQSYSTDYYDVEAQYDRATGLWGVEMLLSEVGYFEFKVRAESAVAGRAWVRWAEGGNVGVSVGPLAYRRGNSIYCAFLRQYVKDKHRESLADPELEAQIAALEATGAVVIGRGGTFESFKQVLPFIVKQLGMKIIHLLPINPVPSAYGRMGMYGSPYATTDYFGVDHTYATFSRYKTIEEQFIDLASTIHGLGAKVMLDMVINHTGWASSLHFLHPQWHKVGADGQIVSPGAWGVVWEDLVELDYRHVELWRYMAEVFLAWCRRGVDAYRLDAGYMIDKQVWRYIISRVREDFPDTLFLLEGLGGPWETTETLLTDGQMNWAYSELFQNYSREQITSYLDYAQRVSASKGVMVHYAETHDNERLAKRGRDYTRMRLAVSALTSFAGAWGITNGVEWLATEKINVHRNAGLRWGNPDNLVDEIAQLNHILETNPAFWECGNVRMLEVGDAEVLAFTRTSGDGGNRVLCAINLNCESPKAVQWKLGSALPGLTGEIELEDLYSGGTVNASAEGSVQVQLGPGGVWLQRAWVGGEARKTFVPALQEVDTGKIAVIYQVLLSRFAPHEVGRIDQEKLLREVHDFRRFIALVNTVDIETLVGGDFGELLGRVTDEQVKTWSVEWTFHERNRELVVGGGQWLVAHTYLPCTAYLKFAERQVTAESLERADASGHEAFFAPPGQPCRPSLTFNWKISRDHSLERSWQGEDYPVRWLRPPGQDRPTEAEYPLRFTRAQAEATFNTVILTNELGAVCQWPAVPGRVYSKYDTLLSVPLSPERPTDRASVARPLQETVRVGAKYFSLDQSFLRSFTRYPQPTWDFVFDDGEYYVRIERWVVLACDRNDVYVRYAVKEANTPVQLTAKIFLEDRSPHDVLYGSVERDRAYQQACTVREDRPGVSFALQEATQVRVQADRGEFIFQPHWVRGWHLEMDRLNGLAEYTDAFAPGVFVMELNPGDKLTLTFQAGGESAEPAGISETIWSCEDAVKERFKHLPARVDRHDPVVGLLARALGQMVMRIGGRCQVLTGLPWLGVRTLDTLASVGGLLAAGHEDAARDSILGAAATEREGVLADWLCGGPAGRRSAAGSLRLFQAARLYVAQTGREDLWDQRVDGSRTLREVLGSIYDNFTSAAPDRVRTVCREDGESGLLWCREGATWMDTTYPVATPRQGYPVEIQVWWLEALSVWEQLAPGRAVPIARRRERLEDSLAKLFWDPRSGHLCDVLRARWDEPARKAQPDPALRFNQLAVLQAGLLGRPQAQDVLDAVTRKLVISGGLRSLAPQPLHVAMEVRDDRGDLVMDPRLPYRGRCVGGEFERRLAYHNGTAWPWAYPGYLEARARTAGGTASAIADCLAWFEPLLADLRQGAIGTLGEMKEGDYPHNPRGCLAYTLSVAEALRVYCLLKYGLVGG